jgi:hypothetical protein
MPCPKLAAALTKTADSGGCRGPFSSAASLCQAASLHGLYSEVRNGIRPWIGTCSPEGIRTPDLFLESDEVERSGLATSLRTNRYLR